MKRLKEIEDEISARLKKIETMTIYRILHKPTGLFYQPKKTNTHLSKYGKFYHRKPNFNDIRHGIFISDAQHNKYKIGVQSRFSGWMYHIDFVDTDWEIKKYKLEETD